MRRAKERKRTGEPKRPTSELVYPVLQYTGGLDQREVEATREAGRIGGNKPPITCQTAGNL